MFSWNSALEAAMIRTTLTIDDAVIAVDAIHHNAPPAVLYEEAIAYEDGTAISSSGALIVRSGEKTGRSPKDKRIVGNDSSRDEVWWGEINIPIEEHTFFINRERAIDYLNSRRRLYVVDGFAGADHGYRIKVRVICSRAYHALFMYNLLIRPTAEELETFDSPDLTILNAGRFPANKYTRDMTSSTSVDLSLERGELVILGTQYAGEMKKGVFSYMNYLMPKRGVLSMHCSANASSSGETALFFGLSGTGKTTLSADPTRRLIGDDEHCWSDHGIFNIEGGCYAKCINLSPADEPLIYSSIRFGSVLENVIFDDETRLVDYADGSLTENTRACYPLDFVDNADGSGAGEHPRHIIFLTADAFGVLPPVARLTVDQAVDYFLIGYTAKVAGTEDGIVEPQATFSPCFGAAFMLRHPKAYADLLAEKIKAHGTKTWLVNTGWSGGPYGTGSRIRLSYTRSIIDAILSGKLDDAPIVVDPYFALEVVTRCPGVPDDILTPRETWQDKGAYDEQARELASQFNEALAALGVSPSGSGGG